MPDCCGGDGHVHAAPWDGAALVEPLAPAPGGSVAWHRQLSVHAASSLSLGFEDDLRLWDALGIDHVGLMWSKIEALDRATVIRAIGRGGLRVSSLGVSPPFQLHRPDTWAAARQRLLTAIDFAAEVGAGCAYLATGTAPRLRYEQAAARLVEALEPVLDAARAANVRVALEPSGSERADLGFVRTVADLATLARASGASVVADLAGSWAESDLVGTLAENLDQLAVVQLADRPLRRDDRSPRVPPGQGELPLESLVGDIVAAGYRGPLELELVNGDRDLDGYRVPLAAAISWLHDQLGPELVADPASGRLRRR